MAEWSGDPELIEQLIPVVLRFPGQVALTAHNLTTGESVRFRSGEIVPTASVIKVGIMAELYRQAELGIIDLQRRMPMPEEALRGGTGVLKEMAPGLQPTVHDLCRLMIIVSDNTATEMLVNLLGLESINASFQHWGLDATSFIFDPDRDGDIRRYALSTTDDLARIMELIATSSLVSPAASAAMRDHLARQQHREQMARYIPFNQYRDPALEPEPIQVLNKIGCSTGMRADAAIINAAGTTLVLAAVNEGSTDGNYQVDHEGNVLNGQIARIVFEFWTHKGEQEHK